MARMTDTALGDFTRGGQTTLMFYRMIGEVIHKGAGLTLLLYSICTVSLFVHRTDDYERYLVWKYAQAWTMTDGLKMGQDLTDFRDDDGGHRTSTYHDVAQAPEMKQNIRELLYTWLGCMVVSFTGALSVLAILFVTIFRFGKSQRGETLIRGVSVRPAAQVREELWEMGMASDLKLAGIPLVKGKETSHHLITGSTGTGKSTVLHGLLARIRERGDRVICFSPSGDFIEWFYRDGTDIILNPFDRRTHGWNPWDECSQPYHYDMLAHAIIPESSAHDQIWDRSARQLVSALLRRCRENGEATLDRFLELLTVVDLSVLHRYLEGTVAASHMDPAAERTAHSIRFTASSYAEKLGYLPREAPPFRIRQWVHAEGTGQWVFLNAKADQLESARVLLSAWMQVLTNSILGLPENHDRRIWIVIDELPSLYKLGALGRLFAEGRKYGACGVIAFQQISQLRAIYGRDDASSLTGLCSTWLCLRQNDAETAKWASECIGGDSEYLEKNEGLSYGSHEMRDGVSLSQQRKMRPVIIPSEIGNLSDLEGYLRLPGKDAGEQPIGIAHFKIERPTFAKIASAFVPRDGTSIVEVAADRPSTLAHAGSDLSRDRTDGNRLPIHDPFAAVLTGPPPATTADSAQTFAPSAPVPPPGQEIRSARRD